MKPIKNLMWMRGRKDEEGRGEGAIEREGVTITSPTCSLPASLTFTFPFCAHTPMPIRPSCNNNLVFTLTNRWDETIVPFVRFVCLFPFLSVIMSFIAVLLQ